MNRGLFEKNLILIGQIGIKSHLLVIAILCIVYVITSSAFSVIIGFSIYVNSFVIELIKEDENTNTIRYVSGLPIHAKKIAGTTYITYYMCTLLNMVVLSTLWILGKTFFGINGGFSEYIELLTNIFMFSSVYSILIPISYRFTTQKVFGFFFIVIFLISIVVGGVIFILKLSFELIFILLIAGSFLIPLIGYFLTVKYVNK